MNIRDCFSKDEIVLIRLAVSDLLSAYLVERKCHIDDSNFDIHINAFDKKIKSLRSIYTKLIQIGDVL